MNRLRFFSGPHVGIRQVKHRPTPMNHDISPHQKLKLLSFNIQVGIQTGRYRHYVTRFWQHFLPHAERNDNLNRIGQLLKQYDLVALQEVDGGSLRSGYVNQIEYLAHQGAFPYWYQQLNRDLGQFAQHSNGLLSRLQPIILEDHKLPGLVPGRGAIACQFEFAGAPLLVVMMHLSLSRRSRNRQLTYVRELMRSARHVVLMGDMNTHAGQLLDDSPLSGSGLVAAHDGMPTFPSWRPTKALDHILVSSELQIDKVSVIDYPMSDHLPVALELSVR